MLFKARKDKEDLCRKGDTNSFEDKVSCGYFGSRGKIYSSFLETIGATPLVRASRLRDEFTIAAEILLKLEFFNPLSSVKDRIAYYMIEQAYADGLINDDSIIVEATSGNTGIALAFICAYKGLSLRLIIPESMPQERRKLLDLLSASSEFTDSKKGMRGAIERAQEIVSSLPNAILLQQFSNPFNPEIHRISTAKEIWFDSGGKIDFLVSGVGTGGTITGLGEILKEYNSELRVIAVEPEDAAALSGGFVGSHPLEGIGAGFVPPILNSGIIDEVLTVSNNSAFSFIREIARLEGIPVGISSGAALAAAVEIGQRKDMEGKVIVVIIPSFAERYLSTGLFI